MGSRRVHVNSWEGVQPEMMDEVQSREDDNGCYVLDITPEDIEALEGKGDTTINASDIEKMAGEEKIKWIGALEAELDPLTDWNAKEDITSQDLYERLVPR